MLVMVVKEMPPNGAQAWQEVAALYQAWSGEMVLQDHDDVKRHWVNKCCNKFKRPTSTPSDPKRDMILRCQWIQERILKKSASSVMGADSEGDEGLDLSEDPEDSEEEEYRDDVAVNLVDGVAVVGAALLAVEHDVAEELAGGIGGRSRNTTLTVMVVLGSWHQMSFLLLRCHPYNLLLNNLPKIPCKPLIPHSLAWHKET